MKEAGSRYHFCLKGTEELLAAMEYLYARHLQFPREYARFEILSAMLPPAKQAAATLKGVSVFDSVGAFGYIKRFQERLQQVRACLVHEIERLNVDPFEEMLQIATEWAALEAVDVAVAGEQDELFYEDEVTCLLAFVPTEKAMLDFIVQAEGDIRQYGEERNRLEQEIKQIFARMADVKKRYQAGELTQEAAINAAQGLREERDAMEKSLVALEKAAQYAQDRVCVAHSFRRLQFDTLAELSYRARLFHMQTVGGDAVIHRLTKFFSTEEAGALSARFDALQEVEALIERLQRSIRGEEEEPWLVDDAETM